MQTTSSLDPTNAWRTICSHQKLGRADTIDPSSRSGDNPCPDGHVRIVCISDTHGKHDSISVPPGNVLIHSGDFTNTGGTKQIEAFVRWFEAQPHAEKVLIAGNHDTSLDTEYYARMWQRYHKAPCDSAASRALVVGSSRFVYLEDAGHTLRCGLTVWGSPWQPEFCDWAFNLDRGEPCAAAWRKIPDTVDILVTHGPPLGHGDLCSPSGHRAGCLDLLRRVSEVQPALHCFGHVHEGFGVTSNGVTQFANASTCTLQYKPNNPALVFDLPVTQCGSGSASGSARRGGTEGASATTAATVQGAVPSALLSLP